MPNLSLGVLSLETSPSLLPEDRTILAVMVSMALPSTPIKTSIQGRSEAALVILKRK